MIRTLLIAIIAVSFFTTGSAQQEALYAQFFNNTYLLNPGEAGTHTGHRIRAFHRWQWAGFPGAPVTYGITYQGQIARLHGIGAMLFRDVTGPTARTGGKLTYAFQLPIQKDNLKLGIGISGKAQRNTIDFDAIDFVDPNDLVVSGSKAGVWTGDIEFGLYARAKKWYAGVTAPNLIQSKFDYAQTVSGRDPIAHLYRHYFAYGGYIHDFGKVQLEPIAMVKYVAGAPVQVDAGIRVHTLKKQLAFGVAWRSPSFISFNLSALLDKSLPISLSFDISTARFQRYSLGSSEVCLGLDLPYQGGYMSEDEEGTTDQIRF